MSQFIMTIDHPSYTNGIDGWSVGFTCAGKSTREDLKIDIDPDTEKYDY